MRIGEFVNKTNLTIKTAKWLYDNVFNSNSDKEKNKYRHFTDDNVQFVKQLQKPLFVKNHNLKRMEECSDEYYICDNGKIYSYKRGFFEERKPYLNKNGYYYITVWQINKHITYRLHRLVAKYFVSNPNNYDVVNHIDGNKKNNVASNLEWTTISKNTLHAYQNGLAKNDKGFEDSQSKPVKIIDFKGNETIYGSLNIAMDKTGINKGTLSSLAKRHNFSKKHQIKVEFL